MVLYLSAIGGSLLKKLIRRMGAVVLSAALSVGALAMFAGCTTDHPEVTITYTFNGTDYNVDYVLSRLDAPQTVTHFIELADAGFYDGTCIHDYTANFLYGGGYRLVDEQGAAFDYSKDNSLKTFSLEEIDYFTTVKQLEKDGSTFTQSVWRTAGTSVKPQQGEGLYTVYGEQKGKVDNQYGRDYSHKTGALVMYYSAKGDKVRDEVSVLRADDGSVQYENYLMNSATSMFYTYLSPNSNSTLEQQYCVFGMAKDFAGQLTNGLLKAITDYISDHTDEEAAEGEETFSFTTLQENIKLNANDPFEDISKGDQTATYETPITAPILIKSVKVTKY